MPVREDRRNLRTLCYRYGLLAPIEGAEEVRKQILLAHRYRNKLVELELARREGYREALRADRGYRRAELEVEALEGRLEELRADLQQQRTGKRRRQQVVEGASGAEVLKRELSEARKRLKATESKVKRAPEVKEAVRSSGAAVKVTSKTAYREAGNEGLYWGTRGIWGRVAREQLSKGPPPRFKRFDGGGTVGVQLQSAGDRNGFGWEAIRGEGREARTACRLVVVEVPDEPPLRSKSAMKPPPRYRPKPGSVAVLRIRVGGGRADPIYAKFPMKLHRPLPPGARVKWVRVVARRVATKLRWSAHFEFQVPEGWVTEDTAEPTAAAVAVDLRWKTVKDRSGESLTLAAAAWRGEDNRLGAITLPPAVRGELAKAAAIRAKRDEHFAAVKEAVLPLLTAATLMEDHRERVKYLQRWRSPGKLAKLTHWWRENRCPGDAAVLAVLEAWRARDKHLYEYEANARRGALERRLHHYRNEAARLARSYSTLLIEDVDLSRVSRRPDPEDPRYEERSDRAHSQRFEVAPGELRSALVNAFDLRRRTVERVPAAPSSQEMLERYCGRSGSEATPGDRPHAQTAESKQ